MLTQKDLYDFLEKNGVEKYDAMVKDLAANINSAKDTYLADQKKKAEENFKEYLDMKPVELQEHIYKEASWMANQLKVVYEKILHANPILFEKNFVRLLNRYDWSEVEQEHRKWKHEQSEITVEMLQEKRERALEKILRKGIFQYVPKPSANFMEKVDYQYHTKRLEFDFVDSDDYKVEFAKLMKYAVRKEELLIIDLQFSDIRLRFITHLIIKTFIC